MALSIVCIGVLYIDRTVIRKKNSTSCRSSSCEATFPGSKSQVLFSLEPLTLRQADKLDRGRARNANKEVIRDYFELLEKTLDENGLKDKCDRIYNCDESGMQLDSTNDRVLAPKGGGMCIISQWALVST